MSKNDTNNTEMVSREAGGEPDEGKPQDDIATKVAKLDELLADPQVGPHATIVRERARLEKDVVHLKQRNLRVWTAVVVLALGLGMVIWASFWVFPKYRYIATIDNKAICEATTQNDNILTPATLEDFAKDAVLNTFSYDYVNYRTIINDVTGRYYSERGRKAYMESLNASQNLEKVVKGRLIMKAYVTTAPQLESEGKEGASRFWNIDVPMAIDYYVNGNPAPSNTSDYIAKVRVMQEQPSAMNPKGISVDSIVLRPTVRRK